MCIRDRNKEPVKFQVSTNTAYETLPDGQTPLITVEMSDVSVKGRIRIEKRGEVPVDFKDGQFIYEERGIEGMTANIIAREDILDPSNDGTVIYPAGTLVLSLIHIWDREEQVIGLTPFQVVRVAHLLPGAWITSRLSLIHI